VFSPFILQVRSAGDPVPPLAQAPLNGRLNAVNHRQRQFVNAWRVLPWWCSNPRQFLPEKDRANPNFNLLPRSARDAGIFCSIRFSFLEITGGDI
jgi:hypothetical protein